MSISDAVRSADLKLISSDRRTYEAELSLERFDNYKTPAEVMEQSVRYDAIAPGTWPWKNFSPVEVMCKTTLLVPLGVIGFHETMNMLQAVRDEEQRPLVLTSMYRTRKENTRVGGGSKSQHLIGRASDIVVADRNAAEFEALLRKHGATGIGRYAKRGFIHADTRTGRPATWNG